MTEDIKEDTAAPAADQAPVQEQPSTLAETGVQDPAPAETGADTNTKPTGPAWPENWREQLSGGDEKLLAMLKRYTAPQNFAKSFKELRATFDGRKEQQRVELPDNPTSEQLSEYRKANGIPETPDAYEFEVPEGRELNEIDQVVLGDFAQAMHEANMSPSAVKAATKWFFEYEAAQAQAKADVAYQARIETEEKLRQEWGADYRPNVNLMSNVLAENLGSKANEFLQLELSDGTRVGDNEQFIRLMANLARQVGGSTAQVYQSDVQTAGKDLAEQKAELMKMMNSADPVERKRYWSKDVQDRMMRIQQQLDRRRA